jgi:hypothetical protein
MTQVTSSAGGNMLLRNVGWFSPDCTALYPSRQNSSNGGKYILSLLLNSDLRTL